MKCKKDKIFFGILIILISGYFLWNLRPVKIIRAGGYLDYDPRFSQGLFRGSERGFSDKIYYDIIVDHMPLTEWGRIHWYLDHKDELKKKYNIPSSTSYYITFWDIGGGFIDGDKSGDGDLACFTKVDNSNKNCLEKNPLLSVNFDKGRWVEFHFNGCHNYWYIKPNGRPELFYKPK